MELDRKQVEQWLLDRGSDRQWLADQCQVGVRAVGNWLNKNAPRPIPTAKQIIISRLMAEDEAATLAAPPHSLVLEFDDADYERIESRALADGVTIREHAKRRLLSLADYSAEEVKEIANRLKRNLDDDNIVRPYKDSKEKSADGGEANTSQRNA